MKLDGSTCRATWKFTNLNATYLKHKFGRPVQFEVALHHHIYSNIVEMKDNLSPLYTTMKNQHLPSVVLLDKKGYQITEVPILPKRFSKPWTMQSALDIFKRQLIGAQGLTTTEK